MAPNKSKTPADTRVASDKMTPAKKLKFDEKTWSETQTPSCSWNSEDSPSPYEPTSISLETIAQESPLSSSIHEPSEQGRAVKGSATEEMAAKETPAKEMAAKETPAKGTPVTKEASKAKEMRRTQ